MGIFSPSFPPGSSASVGEDSLSYFEVFQTWLESHEPIVTLVISAIQKLSSAVMCSFDE